MPSGEARSTGAKVVVATTVALSFISFWRAAAIVLSDLASSAFYAGGIAEHAIGRERALVHPRRHAVQLRRPLRLHGIVQHVRARRRLRGGARRHGPVRGPAVGFLADLRLHPHRSHQRGQRRPVPGPPAQRDRRPESPGTARFQPNLFAAGFGIIVTVLFLVEQHQGHSRIQRQGAAHHADHHRDGGRVPHLVPHHAAAGAQGAPCRPLPLPRNLQFSARSPGLVQRHHLAADRRHRHHHRLRPLAALHERL